MARKATRPKSVRTPKCPVCADLGRPAGHRAGNKACTSAHMKRKVGPSLKITERTSQEKAKVAETATNKEKATTNIEEANVVEMSDTTEQPKPQRVKSRLPRPKEIELVDRPAAEMTLQQQQQQQEETSQDTRNRVQRAAKARKSSGKVTRRLRKRR